MQGHSFEHLGHHDIPGLSGAREVRAYVPPRQDGAPRPPLLVMFDGQNVFGDEGSFAGGWHAHDGAKDLASSGVDAPVVVAIHHGGPSRIDELGPWATDRGGGQLDDILDYLGRELLPRIRRDLGTSHHVAQTFLGGSSMGGLAAIYGHLHRPDLFGGALAMSPALWFAQRKLFSFLDEQRYLPWSSRLYLDAGAAEGNVLADVQTLAQKLRDRGWCDRRLRVVTDENGGHSEECWRKRFPGALDFLFGHAEAEEQRVAA